jgi:hypothetical protein
MKERRPFFKNSLVFLSLLILLSVFGDASSQMLESEKPRSLSVKEQRLERIEARIKELDDKLDLDLGQKIKVKEILTKEKEEISKILSEVAGKVKKTKERSNTEIEKFLSKRQINLLREVPEEEGDEEAELLQVFESNKH